jgi:hypothetical protein
VATAATEPAPTAAETSMTTPTATAVTLRDLEGALGERLLLGLQWSREGQQGSRRNENSSAKTHRVFSSSLHLD